MSQHAIDNAKAWFANIREMTSQFDDAVSNDPDQQDPIREHIQESPLSVQVRSGWHTPGDAPTMPSEYEILLTTGGPGLRIVGELDEYDEPASATLEWQDWGTPWTTYQPTISRKIREGKIGEYEIDEGQLVPNAEAILLSFARHFYYGD